MPSDPAADAVHTWGWSLLALFLVILVGIVTLAIVKRFALGGRSVSLRGSPRKTRPTDTRSAWEESGRRMPTPEPHPDGPDLKEEP